MVASPLHIFPPQTDEFWRSECLCLALSLMQTPFQLLFFLFLSTESCFCCLPSLHVRDRHTSWIVCMCVCVGLCVCVCGHACMHACMSVFVSMYVWVLQWSRGCFYVSAKCGEWFRWWRTASRAVLGFPLCSEEPNAFIWCWIFVICPWNYNWEHLIPVGLTEWSPPYQLVDMNISGTVCFCAILYCY